MTCKYRAVDVSVAINSILAIILLQVLEEYLRDLFSFFGVELL